MLQSIKRNIIFNGMLTFINVLYPLILLPYVLRVLGPESIGLVNWVNSVIAYFVLFANFGISAFAIRETAALKLDQGALDAFFSRILAFLSVSSVMVGVVYAVFVCLVPEMRQHWLLFAIVGAQLILNPFSLDWFFAGMERYGIIFLRSVLVKIGTLVMTFIFVTKPEDFLVYTLITVIGFSGANILNMIAARKFVKIRFSLPRMSIVMPILKEAFPLFALSIVVTMYQGMIVTVLGFMFSFEKVGLYSTAYKITQLVTTLNSSVMAVLLPRMSHLHVTGQDAEWQDQLRRFFGISSLLVSVISFGVFFCADPLMRLISGDQYLEGINILRILSPIICVTGLSTHLINLAYIPRKKEKTVLWAAFVGGLVAFAIIFSIVPTKGIEYAALAYLLAEIVIFAILLSGIEKELRIKLINKDFFLVIAASALVALFVLFPLSIANLHPVLHLLAACVGSLCLYAFLMIRLFRNPQMLELKTILLQHIWKKKEQVHD